MADNKKNKAGMVRRNVVESLKDLGTDFSDQGSDLLKVPQKIFLRNLLV